MSMFDTIKNDIGLAVGWVEHEAVTLWDYFKGAVTAFAGSEIAQIEGFVSTVMVDVEKGDFAALETAVVNEAEHLLADGEAEALALLAKIKSTASADLQAVLAILANKLGWLAP